MMVRDVGGISPKSKPTEDLEPWPFDLESTPDERFETLAKALGSVRGPPDGIGQPGLS